MKITNKLGLPQAMVDAVSTSEHNAEGNLSATTLLKSIREIVLTKRHWSELEDDVSNRVWAIFGQAVHKILERETETSFTEEFLKVNLGQVNVTGRIDSYDMQEHKVTDYKTCSVWKIKFKDFSDWEKQGLIYAWLLKQNGFECKACEFIALIKDHSQTEARRDPSYPQLPIYIYRFDVTEEKLKGIENYITNKVKAYIEAINLADDDLPPCTDEERWASPSKWAVMKEGRKTAIRLLDSEDEAQDYIGNNGLDKKHYIEFRAGVSRKCQDYCSVCQYCDFWKKLQNETN